MEVSSTNLNASQALDGILGNSKPLEERAEQKTLGQDDFFKLLTTQLSSQDPMAPMEDTAFIAQMANFSSLEMMSQLNQNFESFTNGQNFGSSQNMIGKQVTMLIDGQDVTGIAEGIEMVDGTTRVFVDGRGYNVDSIYKIEDAQAAATEQDITVDNLKALLSPVLEAYAPVASDDSASDDAEAEDGTALGE